MSTPSIWICPNGSASRKSTEMREDLPAPVRPTMPTCEVRRGDGRVVGCEGVRCGRMELFDSPFQKV